ncbi:MULTISPECIES: hypothetical protein [Paenibacillus]|uniref:Uncharacterized protein n=2 Tax=Paenibacillus TaxID=44249 RepID=A0A920CL68_9BACL|nr:MULTISPECIES: hypothetical protein [Paenibacillus]GIO36599.1 hypothetical protein J41TS12_14600 [Paenibacillus antibioticophila]GIO43195.1 hypothetical protein J41TS4_29530 [Paenibacillus apis]
MSNEEKRMHPVSREIVETEGVYTDELGRETYLHKGDEFPADLVLGTTEYKLTELAQVKHAEGRTNPRLVPKKEEDN